MKKQTKVIQQENRKLDALGCYGNRLTPSVPDDHCKGHRRGHLLRMGQPTTRPNKQRSLTANQTKTNTRIEYIYIHGDF